MTIKNKKKTRKGDCNLDSEPRGKWTSRVCVNKKRVRLSPAQSAAMETPLRSHHGFKKTQLQIWRNALAPATNYLHKAARCKFKEEPLKLNKRGGVRRKEFKLATQTEKIDQTDKKAKHKADLKTLAFVSLFLTPPLSIRLSLHGRPLPDGIHIYHICGFFSFFSFFSLS